MDLNAKKRKRRGRVPDNERIRKAVACAECKRQKLKCVGEHPCDRCLSKGIQCKQEPRIRVSQETLATSLQRLSYMEAIINTAFPGIETSVEQLKLKLAELNGDAKAKDAYRPTKYSTIRRKRKSHILRGCGVDVQFCSSGPRDSLTWRFKDKTS
ncbi:hypothetical protein BZL39_M00270 [Zygosaccharomyces parabailii]|nr:hypothetical protein BZL39_F06150 [Zygosaccharomyces parabailii]AQZ17477.1 hypothetical protein BZL39_M00270 [Zygosaccharomyces parabailii]CDH17458.1 uncharacterized protein ZBAI_09246 [Zygosaccharomyces bailii ISA1307]